MSDREKALEALVRKLPRRADRIISDADFQKLADHLYRSRGRIRRSRKWRQEEISKTRAVERLIVELRKCEGVLGKELGTELKAPRIRAQEIRRDRGPAEELPPQKRGESRLNRNAQGATEGAAQVYWEVTGKRLRLSRHPDNHKEIGTAFDFLSAVFKILDINGKPASQIEYLRQRPNDVVRTLIDRT